MKTGKNSEKIRKSKRRLHRFDGDDRWVTEGHGPGRIPFGLGPLWPHLGDFTGAFGRVPEDPRSYLRPHPVPGAGREGEAEARERPHYAGVGPKGYRRPDERIREDVCDRLTVHPDIDPSEIEVHVQDGIVTLSGTIPTRMMKFQAESIAAWVVGVEDVHNQLQVLSRASAKR